MVKKLFPILIFVFLLPNLCFAQWGGALLLIGAPLIMPLIFIIVLGVLYLIVAILGIIPAAGSLIIAIAEGSLEIAEGFFHLVTSPGLIKFSYTKPNENLILAAGLSQTQPLAIAMWIFVFVVCAILIALGIGEYQAKKIIVNLILAAVLIYFMPFICGVFIDATNVIMFHFIKELKNFSLLSKLKSTFESISGSTSATSFFGKVWEKIKTIAEKVWEFLFPEAGEVVATVLVCLTAAVAFIIFGIIFLARYAFLWALVILSPIAIVAWTFPEIKEPGGRFISAIKSFWDWWEEQFFHWCVIGITLGFFLWLAAKTNEVLQDIYDPTILEHFSLTPLIVVLPVLIFLYLGYTLGLRTGAMLGGALMAGTAALATGIMTGIARAGAKRVASGVVEKMAGSPKWRATAEKWSTAKPGLYTEPEGKEKEITRFGAWVRRSVGRPLAGAIQGLDVQLKQRVEEIEKEDVISQLSRWRSASTNQEKLAALMAMVKSGNLKDAMDKSKVGAQAIEQDEIEKMLNYAKAVNPKYPLQIASAHPQIIGTDAWKSLQLPGWNQILPQIEPADMKKMMPSEFLKEPSDEFLTAMVETGSIDQLRTAILKGKEKFQEAFQRKLLTLAGDMGIDQYLQGVNPDLYFDITRNPGMSKLFLERKIISPSEAKKEKKSGGGIII